MAGEKDVAPITEYPIKGYRRGTHRLVPPEQTWRVVEPLLPEFGITRVADITGLDEVGIPVHQAVRPAARGLSVSQGKGVTHELARVSAVMEMIELAHAERIRPASVRGPATQVHDGSYDLRDLQLVAGSMVSDSVVLDWVAGRSILTGAEVLVPRDYVQVSNEFRREWAPPLFNASSNGLASGNSVDEATLHGLYELIERQCLSDLEYVARDAQPRLAPTAVQDADCQWLIERLTAADNWFEIIDATNQLGIPCYQVHIWSPSFQLLIAGSGAHLDPAVALNRALTEAAQSRLAIITGTRESIPEQVYLLQQMSQERPGPLGADAPVSSALPTDRSTSTIRDDLRQVASRLAEVVRTEPLVVELSSSDAGFAVIKAVVPGLRFDSPAHGTARRIRQG